MPSRFPRGGFTLLEVLVAMAIFSGLALVLGKFCHHLIDKIFTGQSHSEYQFQCNRLLRVLREDLRFASLESVECPTSGVYTWVQKLGAADGETSVRRVYANDGQGNIYRVLLPVAATVEHFSFDRQFVVATGIGNLVILPVVESNPSVKILISDLSRKNNWSLQWRLNSD
jgi:prepilin-type N-terminal cleavage/methylation domain-containing protein